MPFQKNENSAQKLMKTHVLRKTPSVHIRLDLGESLIHGAAPVRENDPDLGIGDHIVGGTGPIPGLEIDHEIEDQEIEGHDQDDDHDQVKVNHDQEIENHDHGIDDLENGVRHDHGKDATDLINHPRVHDHGIVDRTQMIRKIVRPKMSGIVSRMLVLTVNLAVLPKKIFS